MDTGLLLMLIAIVIVGGLVLAAMTATKKRGASFDKENYQVDFLRIENTLARDNELSYNAVVTDADKLLDKALCEAGARGKNMGERLKSSGSKFSQLNAVWYAHRLRNQIAHEHGFKLEYKQAQHALATYRQALKDLGAI